MPGDVTDFLAAWARKDIYPKFLGVPWANSNMYCKL